MDKPLPIAVYRVLDLFSGIGGFSLGLERTGGFETVAFCEIDPFCRDVLAKHWPGVPCTEDVETREFTEGEADVITGGFPCQDISFAGRGAGLSGERSGLYRHILRAIRLVRPRYAILENVAALLSRGMGTVLGDLAEIGADAEWHCIPASAVGAPHIRDRVWIVAKPQHPDADQPGPHRAGMHKRAIAAEFRDEQVCLSGSLGEALSDANGQGKRDGTVDAEVAGASQPVPDAGHGDEPERTREAWRQSRQRPPERRVSGSHGEVGTVADADKQSQGRLAEPRSERDQWLIEPDVGRVAHGVPSRVDRLRALGNAVVPQIPEIIGRAILASERAA